MSRADKLTSLEIFVYFTFKYLLIVLPNFYSYSNVDSCSNLVRVYGLRSFSANLSVHRSAVVKPGEQFTFVAPADLKITNIALGEKLEDENGRTTVKLKHESITRKPEDELKTTVVICSLIGGKVRAMRVVR